MSSNLASANPFVLSGKAYIHAYTHTCTLRHIYKMILIKVFYTTDAITHTAKTVKVNIFKISPGNSGCARDVCFSLGFTPAFGVINPNVSIFT